MPHLSLIKLLLLLSTIGFFVTACNTFSSSENRILRSSVDTVFFDTILSGRKTPTKILKIYNEGNTTAYVSTKLTNNIENSFFVNINGITLSSQNSFNIEPKDSIYIFIEALSRAKSNQITNITANLEISSDMQSINIPIIAHIQDYTVISGYTPPILELNSNGVYLIKDSVVVKSGNKLIIGRNSKLLFDKNSYLRVMGSITALGGLSEKIIFCGSRIDNDYTDIAGQWRGIFIESDNTENIFENCEIKNSISGISIYGVNVQSRFYNCIIQHNSYSNLLVNNSDLFLSNCLLGDCGTYSLKVSGKSNVSIINSTIANYWSAISGHGIRVTPSVLIQTNTLSSCYFGNSIIFGNRSEGEFSIDHIDLGSNKFEYSLFKISDSSVVANKSSNCLFNPKFKFKQPYEPDYDYSLDSLSIAKDAGDINIIKKYVPLLDSDILGKNRTSDKAPDIGAYEKTK